MQPSRRLLSLFRLLLVILAAGAFTPALAQENSEKLVEVQWDGDRVVRTGDQFGLGRRTE